jgi:hypothetical protein
LLTEPWSLPATPVARERRPWAAPRVHTVTNDSGPVLLCTTGRPFVCEGGGCCDVSPDCDYKCNGG